jgi:hypothetical protein
MITVVNSKLCRSRVGISYLFESKVAGLRIRSDIQYRAKGGKGCQAEERIVDECREVFTFSKRLEIKKALAVLPLCLKVWNRSGHIRILL